MTTAEDFAAAYDRLLARWPVPVDVVDLPSAYGVTRVTSAGPPDGPPLILSLGGGATSMVWFAAVREVSRHSRVHAVDLPGDAGRTVPGARPVRAVADLHGWLDAVVAGVAGRADRVDLAGHSYGGWIALTYAIRTPSRVRRLVLVDPPRCFGGFSPGYLAHALPVLLRPSAGRMGRLLRWETRDRPLDPGWLALAGLAAELPRGRPVTGGKPTAGRLRALDVPTLVLLAERSRAHNARRVGAAAGALLPHGTVSVLPGASHHSLPFDPAAALDRALAAFLHEAAVGAGQRTIETTSTATLVPPARRARSRWPDLSHPTG